MADLLILALTVFTFQNNAKIAVNIHLLEIFALLLVFSYQFTTKCLSLPPPLLGGAISKPLTLPFALAFRIIIIETVVTQCYLVAKILFFGKKVIKYLKKQANLDKLKPILGSAPPNYPNMALTSRALEKHFLFACIIELIIKNEKMI